MEIYVISLKSLEKQLFSDTLHNSKENKCERDLVATSQNYSLQRFCKKTCNCFFQKKLFWKKTLTKSCKMSFERNSRPEVFCKESVLGNFAKFSGKHPCQSLFVNKVRPATLLKKRLWHRCFPVNFAKFLRTPFLIEHLWWLLLF